MNSVKLTNVLFFYKRINGSLPGYLNERLVINNTQHTVIEARGMLALILSALVISVRLKEAVLLLYQQQDFGIMCF